MPIRIDQRYELNSDLQVLSGQADGLASINLMTLPADQTRIYVVSLLVTDIRKELNSVVAPVAQNVRFRFGNLGGTTGFIEQDNTLPMAAGSRSMLIRTPSFTIADDTVLIQERLYFGPGAVTPRDDFFFTAREVIIWSAEGGSNDFASNFWASGINLLTSHAAADIDTAITNKLDAILQHHSDGVKVGEYKAGIQAPIEPNVAVAASRITDMVSGAGATAAFTATALANAVDTSAVATDVNAALTASHGSGNWQTASSSAIANAVESTLSASHGAGQWSTADLAPVLTAIAALPTSALAADDPRLDNLDAPVSAPVVVGAYAEGLAPSGGSDYTARFDAIDTAIGNVPTNPLLTNDSRLATFSTFDPATTSVILGSYATGLSPGEQVSLTATNAAIAAIPTNPLRTNDSRLAAFSTFDPAATNVTVGGYATGLSPGEQIDLSATNAAIAAIPTNPLQINDTRLDVLTSLDQMIDDTQTNRRFTSIALVNAPTGSGGGSTDLTPVTNAIAAVQTTVDSIPTNPLLISDARLDNLDQRVSDPVTVGGYSVGVKPTSPTASDVSTQVRSDLAGDFTALSTAISTRLAAADYTDPPTTTEINSHLAAQHGAGPWTRSTDPVTIGGYAAGQSPVDLLDIRFDTLVIDIGNIPTNPLLASDTRLNTILSEIENIPTNPLLADDTRLNDYSTFNPISDLVNIRLGQNGAGQNSNVMDTLSAIDTSIANSGGTDYTARFDAIDIAIGSVPTNPLLTNDARLSTFSTFDPAATNVTVGGYVSGQSPVDLLGTRLTNIDTVIASLGTAINNVPTNPLLSNDARIDSFSTFDPATADVTIDNVRLTNGAEQTAQTYFDSLDSTVITRIAQVQSTLDNLDISVPSNLLLDDDPRLDNLDAPISAPVVVGAYANGSEPSLDSTAITTAIAAVQTGVDAIPTNPLLTTDARLSNLDTPISNSLQASAYVAPDNAGITAAMNAAETVRDSRTLPMAQYATEANQQTIIASLGVIQSGVSPRVAVVTSSLFEVPDSGSVPYSIVIQSNDTTGAPVDLDASALPVVTAFAGTNDRSANLSAVTRETVGRYRLTYTASVGDTHPESILISSSGTQGGTSYMGEAVVTVSDSSATDYTLADRTRDNAIQTALASLVTASANFSTFDHTTNNVTVGGYAPGQEPGGGGTFDLTATNNAIAAVNTIVSAIPTNPLLTNDPRIDAFSTFNPTTTNVNINLAQILSDGTTVDNALVNGGSLGAGPISLNVTVLDENGQAVPNIVVDLLTDAGDRTGVWGNANSQGKITFHVVASSYRLTIGSTPGITLAAPVAVAAGSDPTDFTLNVTRTPTTLPVVAGMCLVDDCVLDSQFNPVANAKITAVVNGDAKLVDKGIATLIVAQAITDAAGRFQLRLPTKSNFTEGAVYAFQVQSDGNASIFRSFSGVIPNKATCLLKEIEDVLV